MKNFFKDIPIYRIISGALAIICMIAIFLFSCENSQASSQTSGEITYKVIEITVPEFEEYTPLRQNEILLDTDHIIRKQAHFTIYAALGFFISGALGKRRLLSKKSALALIISSFYACTDELHQLLVEGRSGQLSDILLDSAGALCGIIASILFMKLFLRKINT